MAYISTNKNFVGRIKVKRHAIKRMKERYGNKYIGNKKIKNCSHNKIAKYIRKKLKNDIKYINEQEDNSLEVKTDSRLGFNAIIIPEFNNVVITIY